MVTTETIDPTVFAALGDSTRLAVITRLTDGPATVSALARDHPISMPGLLKHLRVLERAGLLQRVKAGRVVTCSLKADRLTEAERWLHDRTSYWEATLDRLDELINNSATRSEGTP